MSLGLPKGQNYLVPHDPSWRRQFEEERRRLRAVLGADASDIQHIGSTAVPGIHAKPIVDIVVAARSHTLADDWQDAMASLGYDYPGDIGIPGHRVYGRDGDIRRFLVHVVDADGLQLRRLIGFRDMLLGDPQLAREYEALKLEAAAKHPTGPRKSYTDEKATYIEEVLARRAGDG